MKSKSRNLSAYDYFQVLQIEWISADIRSKVYPIKSDREFWKRVKEGKKAIITTIAEKNQLPTIFTDDEMKHIFERKVYGAKGFPNFSYRDDEQRARQENFDLEYYYFKGAEVRFEYFGETKVGKIKSFNIETKTVEIEVGNNEINLPHSEVSRIL